MERDITGNTVQFWKKYFNSHAHVERDINVIDMLNNLQDFNSHAHVERDACEQTGKLADFNFNSHAHVERDQIFRD